MEFLLLNKNIREIDNSNFWKAPTEDIRKQVVTILQAQMFGSLAPIQDASSSKEESKESSHENIEHNDNNQRR